MRYALIALLIVKLAHADMIVLKKGEIAPNDGILVDAAQMKEFRQTNEEKKLLNLENLKLKDLSDINSQRIDLYKEQVKQSTDALSSSERKGYLYNVGFFVLGVVITGFAAKAAIEATR